MNSNDELLALLGQAKQLAKRYREIAGRPLGITGEIAESEAVRLLGLELAPVRTAGYDVIRRLPDMVEQHLQVKGRVTHTKNMAGQRMGAIDAEKEWDAVLLVLMDLNFNTFAIYEAPRAPVVDAISRTKRGALSIPLFRRIGRQVWPPV